MTDYVIVGAGTAGCVLAGRLSEHPDNMVTLIEAGGRDTSILYRMPAGYVALMANGKGNWRYSTVPQEHLNNRSIYYPRGQVLGGSSSINGLVHVRGNREDYDGWSRNGASGWSYDECLPWFRKSESWSGGETELRGGSGPVGVTRAPPADEMSPLSKAWMKAGVEAGFCVTEDANGASQEGFSRTDNAIAAGVRQSASAAYLAPARKRKNLRIICNALALRVNVKHSRARSVDIRVRGKTETLETEGEIILCCGAINTPQLLMVSGIGPADHIRAQGLRPIADLPGVGKNLQDHLSIQVQQDITLPYSALSYTRPHRAIASFIEYLLRKTGPATGNGLEAQAFLQSDPNLTAPDIQYHFPLLMYSDYGRSIVPHEGFAAVANATRPRSTGSIRLRSSDPSHAPLIDPNYLSNPHDMHLLKESVRIARDVISQPAFEAFRGAERSPGSDRDLESWIRETACTMFHPVGTCRMGTDEDAVVDASLKVRGLEGLRIVDASVMPTLVSGNTNAAVLMIAEKISSTILGSSILQ